MTRGMWSLLVLIPVLPLTTAVHGSDARQAPFVLELEGGPVLQSKNDVQIPNDENGTRFSLVDLVGHGPWPSMRLYLTWDISHRHGLRAVAAPLTITETGVLPAMVRFAGRGFDAETRTKATYQFNSWRLGYRYRLHDGDRWAWWIGFTAKIRDAKIELQQGSVSARKTDVGFVPLLHVEALYRFSECWRAVLDADALAGGPGRAEDVSLKICANIHPRWSASAGYRTVEGGADVDEVYNFAWLHYAVLSVAYRF